MGTSTVLPHKQLSSHHNGHIHHLIHEPHLRYLISLLILLDSRYLSLDDNRSSSQQFALWAVAQHWDIHRSVDALRMQRHHSLVNFLCHRNVHHFVGEMRHQRLYCPLNSLDREDISSYLHWNVNRSLWHDWNVFHSVDEAKLNLDIGEPRIALCTTWTVEHVSRRVENRTVSFRRQGLSCPVFVLH